MAPLQALWFGGDVARIVGECSCPDGYFFDDNEMECQQASIIVGAGAIVGLLAAALFACCCCGCICFMIVRKMS